MLFNMGMIVDIRIARDDFFISNDNTSMINLPKGAAISEQLTSEDF
jgi:hypothetical protein